MAHKKESFFQKIIGLFMSSESPEAVKRRKLKDIAKTIGKTRYSKWYKSSSQEVLPQAAQFFYSIYKVVGPAPFSRSSFFKGFKKRYCRKFSFGQTKKVN